VSLIVSLSFLDSAQAMDGNQLSAMMMAPHHHHHHHQQQQQQQQGGGGVAAAAAAPAGDAPFGDARDSDSESVTSSSDASDVWGAAGDDDDDEAWSNGGVEDTEAQQLYLMPPGLVGQRRDEARAIARHKAEGVLGRIEPGVLALRVDGAVIATCNTLGCTLVADYGRAQLGPRWWGLGGDAPGVGVGVPPGRGGGGGGGGGEEDEEQGEEGEEDEDGLPGKFWSQMGI